MDQKKLIKRSQNMYRKENKSKGIKWLKNKGQNKNRKLIKRSQKIYKKKNKYKGIK
jgi:hypothetical protein